MIEDLVRSGRHQEAKKEIARLKKTGLTSEIRLQCSDWYLRIGLPNEAIKVIGPELSELELKLASIENLKLQNRLAYMLGYFGANQSAERISAKLKPYIHRDKDLAAQYFRVQAGNSLRIYDYPLATENYKKAIEYLDPEKEFYQFQMMRLGYADGLEGMGQFEKAIQIAMEVLASAKSEHLILKAIAHQAIGEYFLRQNRLQNAKENFEASWKYFPKNISSRDYGFLAKWSGALELKLGNKKKSKEYLDLALKILSHDRLRPTNILEVLFWLSRLNPNQTRKKYWVLYTHPAQIRWIQDQIEPKKNQRDVYELQNNELRFKAYSDEVKKNKIGTIDLVSGTIYQKKYTTSLSLIKTKTLLALSSAAHLGLSDWALVDYIYDSETRIGPSMIVRLNDVIKQLRQTGFKIKRVKNQFFWQPPKGVRLLLPPDHKIKGLLFHLQQKTLSFKREDLEKAYGIKPATAKTWLKEWISKNQISSGGQGRNTVYRIQLAQK